MKNADQTSVSEEIKTIERSKNFSKKIEKIIDK